MTATVNNKNLNATYQQTQVNNTKPEVNPDNVFVFEDANGDEFYYLSMAEYLTDIEDGTIDNTRKAGDMDSLCFFKDEEEKSKFEKFKDFMADIEMKEKGMTFEEYKTLTAEEIAEYYAEQSASATKMTEITQSGMDKVEKSRSDITETNSEDKDVTNEKNAEIEELKKEIKQLEEEEKEAKEEKIEEAVKKANEQYDPKKHGNDKEAYINKQVAGLTNTGKTKSAELKDQLKNLETEVKDLFSEIASRTKINKQTHLSRFNMCIKNTFSTAATLSAENARTKALNIAG